MAEVSAKALGHVGSGADDSCTIPADTEIMGVPLCEAHAREQEAYFTLGELAQAFGMVSDWEKQARSRSNEPLLEILRTARSELGARVAKQREFVRAGGVRS